MSNLLAHVDSEFTVESYSDGRILSGSDIIKQSLLIAEHLKEYNTVLLCASNSIEWIEVYLAATMIVPKVVLVDSTIDKETLDVIIAKHNPDFIFSSINDVKDWFEKSGKCGGNLNSFLSRGEYFNSSVITTLYYDCRRKNGNVTICMH